MLTPGACAQAKLTDRPRSMVTGSGAVLAAVLALVGVVLTTTLPVAVTVLAVTVAWRITPSDRRHPAHERPSAVKQATEPSEPTNQRERDLEGATR